jgi:hypothetical protein
MLTDYKVQQFGRSVRESEIITIDTPLGFIQVTGKNVEVLLPKALTAHKGMKRAAQHSKYLAVDGDRVYPKWTVLSPVTNKDGEIVDAVPPDEFVVAVGEQTEEHNDVEPE